jgi:hypothetical protein
MQATRLQAAIEARTLTAELVAMRPTVPQTCLQLHATSGSSKGADLQLLSFHMLPWT